MNGRDEIELVHPDVSNLSPREPPDANSWFSSGTSSGRHVEIPPRVPTNS
jgi:hypothetical protein